MLFGMFFAFWRFLEIITLIPTVGMLSYFVHIYVTANALTPDSILVLFIVSVLAVVWAIGTLFTYHRARSNALFVGFVDLCFVGAFIAGVYLLRYISNDNCTSVDAGNSYSGSLNLGVLGSYSGSLTGLDINVNKTCGMLKACWAFGIMNCIMFFITAILALGASRGTGPSKTYVRETHVTRHGHRRSGSHRSHRSSHSGQRRVYV